MSMGSSAPEIMICIIEIFQKNFQAGDLGPGTIIGTAAYNLFMIIAVCMVSVPKGETRRIKHLRVFIVTAFCSIFAYIWMYVLLKVLSPGRVDIWEAAGTLIMFPIFVLIAYMADRRCLCFKYLDTSYKDGDYDHDSPTERDLPGIRATESKQINDARRMYITAIKELRRKHPHAQMQELEALALESMLSKGPKSRAFYRIMATRQITGGSNIMRRAATRAQSDLNLIKSNLSLQRGRSHRGDEEDAELRIYFDPSYYVVMESCGDVDLRVVRYGDLSFYTTVEYLTEDGTAEAGSDYVASKGVINFPPGVFERFIKIQILDDDIFEQDEHFFVHLTNASKPAMLTLERTATIMILDDDHSGIFIIFQKEQRVSEAIGTMRVKVQRYSGARGRVLVNYYTEDETARSGRDYESTEGVLIFENTETEKHINIKIINSSSYSKDVVFNVFIEEPQLSEDDVMLPLIKSAAQKNPVDFTEEEKMAVLGRPRLGEIFVGKVHIREDEQFKRTVNQLVNKTNVGLYSATTTWKDEVVDSLTVESGWTLSSSDDDMDMLSPPVSYYILHFSTLFWRILFSFMPPTQMWNGYLCFITTVCLIALLSTFLADIAMHFGCTVGISDFLTSISLVAIGVSLPDTFASRIAAISDKTADNSIGNVTGSNAVNVFVGLGLAWTVATSYHYFKGSEFYVTPGSVVFSVVLYILLGFIAIAILMMRRTYTAIFAELGGPTNAKWICACLLVILWILFLVGSALEANSIVNINL